jgi:hypothetical protein
MPQSDGRRLSWGPVIEGSLEAWRLAHPAALVANLEGRTDIGDEDLAFLGGVIALNISGCSQARLTDSAFASGLGEGLRALDCTGCTQLTNATLASLGPQLRELALGYCSQASISDAGFAGLKRLRALDLSYCTQDTLTNTALAHVGETLLWLNLEGCMQPSLSGNLFSYLHRLTHLALSVREGGAYTDAHFSAFEGMRLRSLTLWNAQAGSRLTDRTFHSLAGLETLELSFRAGAAGPAVSRAAFSSHKGRLKRLFMHGAVPEVFKDAARSAGLEIRGRPV